MAVSAEDLWGNVGCEPTPEQLVLANYMSEVSEEAFFAGWLIGIEFTLWRLASHPSMSLRDCCPFTMEQALRLRALSKASGGWVYWDDGIDGLAFVSLERWRQIYAAKEGALHWENVGLS